MTPRSDSELLREYTASGTDAAFGALVERHIGLVYSTALRIIVDPHLAEDVTQTTFTALARQAGRLVEHPVLPAWLHRTASNQAANLVRGEMRRRAREQEAHAMEPQTIDAGADWKQVAPLLDDALNQLPESDRLVIFLRFFGTKSAREISHALRVTEEAAQKRVTRAVGRLRGVFARRGVTLSAVALASLFASHATASVPPALALSVTTGALSGGTAATGFFSITAVKIILMSKLKIGAVCALVVAGVVTPLIIQKQRSDGVVAASTAAPPTPEPAPPASSEIDPVAERQRYEAEVARNVNMLKRVGMELRLSMRDNTDGYLDAEQVLTTVGAGSSGRKPVELLVPNIAELRQLMSRTPGTIVARTAEPIRTPEGKWLRIYTLADGSAQQRITENATDVFEGSWQLAEAK